MRSLLKDSLCWAISEDAFPAIRVRSRYIMPAAAVAQMVNQATESGCCVDVAAIAAERRLARDVAQLTKQRAVQPSHDA